MPCAPWHAPASLSPAHVFLGSRRTASFMIRAEGCWFCCFNIVTPMCFPLPVMLCGTATQRRSARRYLSFYYKFTACISFIAMAIFVRRCPRFLRLHPPRHTRPLTDAPRLSPCRRWLFLQTFLRFVCHALPRLSAMAHTWQRSSHFFWLVVSFSWRSA